MNEVSNDRRQIFIDPLLDKAMARIGPLFAPVKQATENILMKYGARELAVILGFVNNCNKMTQELTSKMRDETVQDRENTTKR